MKQTFATTLLVAGLLAAPLHADAVDDALNAALAAHAAGDLSTTAAQITVAGKEVQALQSAKLAAMLPEAPEGWSREVNTDGAQGMAMMGMSGNMVEARYTNAAGDSFTLTLTADSPIVASMAGMLGTPQMMAMMGKIVKAGSQDMLEQDGSLSALAGGRVLVQAQGMESAAMLPVLATLDFARLPAYDK